MTQANRPSESQTAASKRPRVVVACADPEIRQVLFSVLGVFDLQPVFSQTLDDVKELLTQGETAMVFSQPSFNEGSFEDVLRATDRIESRVPVIVCSEFYDKDLYIDAMSRGAFDYLAFPYRREDVEWIINNALNWGPLLRGRQDRRSACRST